MKSNIRIAMALAIACSAFGGCTICIQNRVFPKATWAWTHDAQLEREARARDKEFREHVKDL